MLLWTKTGVDPDFENAITYTWVGLLPLSLGLVLAPYKTQLTNLNLHEQVRKRMDTGVHRRRTWKMLYHSIFPTKQLLDPVLLLLLLKGKIDRASND